MVNVGDIRSRAIAYARQQPLTTDVELEASLRLCAEDYANRQLGDAVIPRDIIAFPDLLATWSSETRKALYDSFLVQLKISQDNRIADGFEMGYAAALDDRKPVRALVDPMPGSRRMRASRAAKRSK